MADGWWDQFLGASEWAWSRRFAVRGKPPDPTVPLTDVDFAAGALADPAIADALEAEGVELGLLEDELVRASGRVLDHETLRVGSGRVAFRRSAAAVSIDDVWTYLLSLEAVSHPTSAVGIYVIDARWGVSGWGSVLAGVPVVIRYAFRGRQPRREAILVEDHDVVTRNFVFELLREDAQLTAIAALRAIRRIEEKKEAAVFTGSPAQVETRWRRMTKALAESGSPLQIRREPRW